MAGEMLRRSRADLVALGGYMGIVAAAFVFAVAWAVISAVGGSATIVGVVASSAAVIALVAAVTAALRSRAEIDATAVTVINPWRTRTIKRGDIQAVTVRRATGQVAAAQLRLANGDLVTVVAVGPRELNQFRDALEIRE